MRKSSPLNRHMKSLSLNIWTKTLLGALAFVGFGLSAHAQINPYAPLPGEQRSVVTTPPLPNQEEEITPDAPEPEKVYKAVRLRGLDKITTRNQEFEAMMGAVTRFSNLEIIPRGCWVAPETQHPEHAGLLEVWHWKPGEQPSLVFFGWMFASSPALSSLEHPVYDLTMLECVEDTPADAPPSAQAE